MSITLSIVICNFNSGKLLADCLDSLTQQTFQDFEIIVVDNGSTDDSLANLPDFFYFYLIKFKDNQGFAPATNRGLKEARGRLVFCLNNDTILAPDCLEKLVDFYQQHSEIGAVAPLIRMYPSKDIWSAGDYVIKKWCRIKQLRELRTTAPYEAEMLSACALLISQEVLQRVGFLEEKYFAYFEDIEWSWEARRAGYSLWVVPEALVYHKASMTSGGNISPLVSYFSIRNNLLLVSRQYQGWAKGPPYLYIMALTGRYALNLWTRKIRGKRCVLRALYLAWRDFLTKKFGRGSFDLIYNKK